MTLRNRALRCSLLMAGALLALVGCAGQQLSADGMKLIQDGQTEKGLALLARASEMEPTNSQLRVDYLKYQLMAVREWLRRGDEARAAGQPAVAREMYLATLRIDPSNYRARRGLEALEADERHRALVVEANKLMNSGDLVGARAKLRQVLLENPSQPDAQRLLAQVNDRLERAEEARLKAASVLKKPVTLQFRDANVRMVFEALSRTTGLNVIFDRDVRADLKTTIFVSDASVGDTVDLILLQNQLEKKVLNANTMLIYPATAAKQKEFQDLKVRTFQISNGDAKHLQTVLKTVLKIKDIALDERTNTLVIRDTADAVAVAEKVVAAHDFPDAEVMLEVEVLEVARDRLLNLGIKWPDNVTVSTPPTASTIGALQDLSYKDLLITPLSVGFNFKLEDTDANLLASPRIRTRNKEKARIMIGDKVPVITNTTTPLSTGAAVVTGSVQYLDVGIKLEVEPQIYAEGDVGIKLFLDVSNIVKEIPGPQGSLAYQIGTRSAQTNLRLRDGETADSRRPDQRTGPQDRLEGSRSGPAAGAWTAVLEQQFEQREDRDHPVDHTAHRPQCRDRRCQPAGYLLRHGIVDATNAVATRPRRRGRRRADRCQRRASGRVAPGVPDRRSRRPAGDRRHRAVWRRARGGRRARWPATDAGTRQRSRRAGLR